MMLQLRLTIAILLIFSSSAFAFGSPDYLPDGARPRIWLTPTELSALASLRDAADSKWVDLEAWCDAHITDAGYNVDPVDQSKYDLTNWGGDNNYTAGYRMSGWATHIYSYALAYQVLKQTGSAQNAYKAATYAARARTLLIDGIATALRAGEENNGLKALRVGSLHDVTINSSEASLLGIGSGSYKFGYSARFLASVPVAYDWIYDTLSSDDKALLVSMMVRWFDWSFGVRSTYNNGVLISGTRYHEDTTGDCTGLNNCTSVIGTGQKGYAYTDTGNNFGGGFSSMLSLIAVSTYGDYAEDSTHLSTLKSYLSTNFIAPLESDIKHSGGDSPEGWNYGGGFIYTLPGLYGYYTATGDTYVTSMSWPKNLVKAALHRTSGDYMSVPMWGYWTGTPYKVNRISTLSKFVGIEKKLRPNGNEAKLGQYLLDTPTYTDTLEAWENLFFSSTNVIASSPADLNEPLSYLAKGNGLYASRSSWADVNTVHVTARLEGKITTAHEGYDEGHITLLRGADVLLGHQNSVGDAPPSNSFNTIVFNGANHHATNPSQTAPSIDRYANTPDYSYVSGDITNAWKRQYNIDKVLLFRRSLLHVRPGIIVVYDVTRSNSAIGNLKEWYTQYEADPTVAGNTITVANGGSKSFISSLYPAGSFTETNPSAGYYRVKYVPTETREYDQFLHVIEAGASDTNQTATSLISGAGGRGALIGSTAAIFTSDQDGEVISNLSYTTNATTHYIADLPISSNVEVFRGGVSLGTFNTGSAGIITFSAAAGEAAYTIGEPVVVEPTCSTDATLCTTESACTTAWPAYHFCSGVCQSATCPSTGVLSPTLHRGVTGQFGIVQ